MAEIVKAKWGEACPVHGFGEDAPEIAMVVREHMVRWRRRSGLLHPREECLYGGVHRHPSPLACFRFVNREHAHSPVNIGPSKAQEFSLPEPRVQRR